MTDTKVPASLWLTSAILVFFAACRPVFEVGRFIYHSDNMLAWGAVGSLLGLLLAAATVVEIRAHGVRYPAQAAIFFSIIASGVLFGASLYASTWANHLWSASPPASFALIQPPHDVGFSFLYVLVNSFLELTVLLALLLNWRISKRRYIILALAITYLVMRVWTYAYFLPTVLDFLSANTDGPPSPQLKARADEWVYLSYFRTAIDGLAHALLIVAAFVPFTTARNAPPE